MNKSSLMLVTLGVLGASAIIRDSRVNRGTSRRGTKRPPATDWLAQGNWYQPNTWWKMARRDPIRMWVER